MTLTVRYIAELDIVESKLSGVVSPEELRRETVEAVATAQTNGCYFFLSDYSEAEIDFTALDVNQLPALQDEEGLDRSAQIALVAPRTSRGQELADFYETVCFNRSWSARTFNDRQSALEWLLER